MRKVISFVVVLSLFLFSSRSYAFADSSNTKEEIVYACLNASGNVDAVYVVNYFNISKNILEDYGDYSEVINLTTVDSLTLENGVINGTINSDTLYYQGTLENAELPWSISLSYTLDGKTIQAEELAGQSGHLSISLQVRQESEDESSWRNNYALQISLSLDTTISKNISAPNATIANVGQNKQLSYILLPGGECNYEVEADIVDFEMDGVEINGIPLSLSIDEPDTSAIMDQLTSLQTGAVELDDGATTAQDGVNQLSSGINSLSSGLGSLHIGSSTFYSSCGSLSNNSSSIKTGLAQFEEGINTLNNSVSSSDASGFEDISSGVNSLADGSSVYLSALDQAIASYEALLVNAGESSAPVIENCIITLQSLRDNYTQIDSGISTISSGLSSGLSGQSELLSNLQSAIITLTGSYSELKAGVEGYVNGADQLYSSYSSIHSGIAELQTGVSNLNSGANSLIDGFSELTDGTKTLREETSNIDTKIEDQVSELLEQYNNSDFEFESFVSSRNTNVVGVQFVIKTESIQIEEVTQTIVEQVEENTSIWHRFLNLFR